MSPANTRLAELVDAKQSSRDILEVRILHRVQKQV